MRDPNQLAKLITDIAMEEAEDRQDRLAAAAYDLCLEMRDDPRWHEAMNRVGDSEAATELRARCPGYSDEEYARAIAQGMMASR